MKSLISRAIISTMLVTVLSIYFSGAVLMWLTLPVFKKLQKQIEAKGNNKKPVIVIGFLGNFYFRRIWR